MGEMSDIPEHIREELRQLIEEGLPVDQIAAMLRLSPRVVESEKTRLNTTGKSPKAR
jgi:DNA-binding CsgD family transcriptional regulator